MDSGSKLPKRSTEDVFAEAIARVEAGEPLEAVAASYPAEVQAELRDLLQIIAVAVQIQHVPVPRPALDRREARKQAFLQTASQLRVEHTVVTPVVAPSNGDAEPTLAERLQAIWAAVQAAFTVRTMRLAPMVVVLAFICLSSFSLATFAQEALPGDIAYPMKEWIRYQKLNLSSPAQQAQVLLENERELQNDIKKVAEKVQQTPGADLNKAIVKARSTMIFHGDEGRYFVIGGLQVLKKYQPDANQNQNFKDMSIAGQLVPGKQVVLEYQILPIQSNDGGAPIVQGIALRVLEDAPVVPTPVPSNTPVPTYTAAPVINANCEAKPLPGWVPYTVQPGDTLSAFAQRTNTSVSRLILVNCLASDAITEGSILLAPPLVPTATPFVPPTPLPTVTPVDTATAIETITAGGTITPVATLDATATGVFTTTEPAIELTLTAIASTPTPTTTPTASDVATEATTEPTTTPATPSTPDGTTSPTATDLATATPTEGTAAASVTPTALTTENPSATPEPGLTPASAETPTSVSTTNTPAAATETAVVVPTQTAVPAATQVALPTAISTPLPPPTTAGSTEGDATKSGAQPTSVQRPTAVIFTPTPIGVSPLR